MLKLEDVAAFLKVAELGGFSRAAWAMGISKSVISNRIARLEKQLDARLVARTTRGVSLTEQGQMFQRRGLALMSEICAARDDLHIPAAGLSGVLRITAPVDFGVSAIAPHLADFLKLHPELHCQMEFSDACADLAEGRFDLALRLNRASMCSPNLRIVCDVESIVVASPSLIAKVGVPADPNALRAMPCLIYAGVAEVNIWRFVSGDRKFAVPVNGAFKTNNSSGLSACAKRGLGFAAVPAALVQAELRDGSLCQVLSEYTFADMIICAHFPPGVCISQAANIFLDFLVKRLRHEPGAASPSRGTATGSFDRVHLRKNPARRVGMERLLKQAAASAMPGPDFAN